jgi:hypothetical protein
MKPKLVPLLLFPALFLSACSTTPGDKSSLKAGSWPDPPNNVERWSADDSNLPYGKPAPDKPGYIISPYHAGYVYAKGFPRGTQVRCPYTGKIFLVP